MATEHNRPAKGLVYNLSIHYPMGVLHFDGYLVGANVDFSGDEGFLIVAYGMFTFAVAEPFIETNSVVYAQAMLMIMLCFGLENSIILDEDSMFYVTFA